MKITWDFADGTVSEVEVDGELGEFITASRREEENLSHKELHHNYSLDACTYEGAGFADDETPDTVTARNEENEQLYVAMQQLTEIQRRRLILLSEGKSMREIARMEGVAHNKIIKSIEQARKKLQKLL